jgi:hypothetical protein
VSAHAHRPDRLPGLGVLKQHVFEARLCRAVGLVAGRRGVGEVIGDLILPHLLGEHARGGDIETAFHPELPLLVVDN